MFPWHQITLDHMRELFSLKKISLIRPANCYYLTHYPPLNLITIGSVLKKEGFEVDICLSDGSLNFKKSLLKGIEKILFFGITATSAEIKDAIAIARFIRKEVGEAIPLVWGGWHTTLYAEQTAESDLSDFVVLGEGESSILDIARGLANSSSYRHHDLSETKNVRKPFVNLDMLPTPNYSLCPDIESFITQSLSDKFLEYYPVPLRWLPYQSSRGCPHACLFCINPVTGNRKYRVKNPVKVATELDEIVKKYNLTHIKIIDDNFFVQKNRVLKIFEILSHMKCHFTWDAECRTDYLRSDYINDDMLSFFKERGLVQLTFGIESGSPSTLLRMRKGRGAGPEAATRAIEMCRKQEISVRGSFVLDIPGDSVEDIYASVRLIRNLREYNKFSCGVHTYRPYPKSTLCEALLREGKIFQPSTLEGWESDEVIREYTDTSAKRPWQKNHLLSSKISFYESLESAFWIKPHQVQNTLIRWVNNMFIFLAGLRNRFMFYSFPIDKYIYLQFKDLCMKFYLVKK